MSNILVSFVRTGVPVLVGSLISWLLARGIVIDEETQTGLTVAFTGIVIGLYYAIARLLERQFPWLGILLGTPQQPVYQEVSTKAAQERTK